MAGFHYKVEAAEGEPTDRPQFQSAIPGWAAGDEIPVRVGRTLVVLAVRENENDEDMPVLVIEDMAG